MKWCLTILTLFCFSFGAKAQKIDSIFFNLYTDSLKKGVHNYINVDGKTSEGRYYPLTEEEIAFTSTAGKWAANSIVVDSSIGVEKITITAALKRDPTIKKSITIFIKKVDIQPELKSEQEIIEDYKKQGKKKKE